MQCSKTNLRWAAAKLAPKTGRARLNKVGLWQPKQDEPAAQQKLKELFEKKRAQKQHHTLKQLQRVLKKARTTAVLKTIRRVKQAREEYGLDSGAVKNLEARLVLLKGLNMEVTSTYATTSLPPSLDEPTRATYHLLFNTQSVQEQIKTWRTLHNDSISSESLLGRSKPAAGKLTKDILAEQQKPTEAGKLKKRKVEARFEDEQQSPVGAPAAKRCKVKDKPAPNGSHSKISAEGLRTIFGLDLKKTPADSESEEEKLPVDRASKLGRYVASDDSGSEEDLVDYDISDEEDGDQHIAATREFLMDSVRNESEMEEMKSDLAASAAAQQPDSWLFVNSLADCANGNRPPRNEDRPRKNRRGQRARQRLLELKFGESAKHKRNPTLDANLRQDASKKIARKERRKAEQTAAAAVAAQNNLHPSWAAKQSSKQEAVIQPFQGTKITFADDA